MEAALPVSPPVKKPKEKLVGIPPETPPPAEEEAEPLYLKAWREMITRGTPPVTAPETIPPEHKEKFLDWQAWRELDGPPPYYRNKTIKQYGVADIYNRMKQGAGGVSRADRVRLYDSLARHSIKTDWQSYKFFSDNVESAEKMEEWEKESKAALGEEYFPGRVSAEKLRSNESFLNLKRSEWVTQLSGLIPARVPWPVRVSRWDRNSSSMVETKHLQTMDADVTLIDGQLWKVPLTFDATQVGDHLIFHEKIMETFTDPSFDATKLEDDELMMLTHPAWAKQVNLPGMLKVYPLRSGEIAQSDLDEMLKKIRHPHGKKPEIKFHWADPETEHRSMMHLQAVAPDNYQKVITEMKKRINMQNDLEFSLPLLGDFSIKETTVLGIARGITPFEGIPGTFTDVRLSDREKKFLSVLDPKMHQKEVGAAIAGMFALEGMTWGKIGKIQQERGWSTLRATATGMGGSAVIQMGYQHVIPGVLSDYVFNKPDSYVLNAAEAALISGVFGMGYAGYQWLKGNRMAVISDELRAWEKATPDEREALLLKIEEKQRVTIKDTDIEIPSILQLEGGAARVAKVGDDPNWVKEFLDPAGVGGTLTRRQQEGLNTFKAQTEAIMLPQSQRLAKVMAESGELSEDLIKAVNEAVTTGRGWGDLPYEVAVEARKLRASVDHMTDRLKQWVGPEMRATFDKNMGVYMHQSYHIDLPDGHLWAKQLREEQAAYEKWVKGGRRGKEPEARIQDAMNHLSIELKDDFAKFITAKYPDGVDAATWERMEAAFMRDKVDDLMARFKDQDELLARLEAGGARHMKADDILKRKGDYPVAIKALWGPVDDVFENYTITYSLMSQYLQQQRMYDDLYRAMVNKHAWHTDKTVPKAMAFKQNGKKKWEISVPDKDFGNAPRRHVFDSAEEAESFAKQWHLNNSEIAPTLTGTGKYVEVPDGYGHLSGMKMQDWMFDTIKEMGEVPAYQNKLLRAWMAVTGTASTAKTAWSPMTHMRNIISIGPLEWAAGRWSIGLTKETSEAFKIAKDVFKRSTDEESLKLIFEMKQLGLLDESVDAMEAAGHMRQAFGNAENPAEMFISFSDQMRNALRSSTAGQIEKAAGKVGEMLPSRLYLAPDNFGRVVAYLIERQELMALRKIELGRELTDAELLLIKRDASEVAKNTHPTYGRVPKGVKWIRQNPVIGQFVSFKAEMVRTILNNLHYGAKDIQHARQLRAAGNDGWSGYMRRGVKRIGSTVAVAGGMGYGIKKGLNFSFDSTAEDEQAMRELGPPWWQNAQLVIRPVEDGGFKVLDMTHLMPHGDVHNLATMVMSEDRNDGDIVDYIGKLFVGNLKIMPQHFAESAWGEDVEGRRIADRELPLGDTFRDRFWHFAQGLEPGAFTQTRKALDAMMGRRTGDAHDAQTQLMSMLTGMRWLNFDLYDKDYGPMARAGRDYWRQTAKDGGAPGRALSRAFKMDEGINHDEMVAAFHEGQKLQYRFQQDLYRKIAAARVLLRKQPDADLKLKKMVRGETGNKMGPEEWRAISSGRFYPMKFPASIRKWAKDKKVSLPPSNVIQFQNYPRTKGMVANRLDELWFEYRTSELSLEPNKDWHLPTPVDPTGKGKNGEQIIIK